jgi:hypothetical protein
MSSIRRSYTVSAVHASAFPSLAAAKDQRATSEPIHTPIPVEMPLPKWALQYLEKGKSMDYNRDGFQFNDFARVKPRDVKIIGTTVDGKLHGDAIWENTLNGGKIRATYDRGHLTKLVGSGTYHYGFWSYGEPESRITGGLFGRIISRDGTFRDTLDSSTLNYIHNIVSFHDRQNEDRYGHGHIPDDVDW